MKDNITCVFGASQLSKLQAVDEMLMLPPADDTAAHLNDDDENNGRVDDAEASTQLAQFAHRTSTSSAEPTNNSPKPSGIRISGYVSKPLSTAGVGNGRGAPGVLISFTFDCSEENSRGTVQIASTCLSMVVQSICPS